MTRLNQILCAALLLLTVTSLPACKGEDGPARSGKVVATGTAEIGGPFELVDQDGNIVTQETIKGKPQLIYFGFSYCPDVCPLALQQMGAALEVVDSKGAYFQPIFISVDPERDTPETLKVYVENNGFPKNLVGLTGTAEQVEAAKLSYKIYSQKVSDPDSAAEYTVDHVSLVFLMDREGKFANVFTHNSTTEDIILGLRNFKKSN